MQRSNRTENLSVFVDQRRERHLRFLSLLKAYLAKGAAPFCRLPPSLHPRLLFISVFSRRELSRGRCKFSSFYLAASIRYRAETTRQISTCRSDLRLSFISCPFARLRNSKHTDRQREREREREREKGTPPFPFSKSRVSSCRTSNALEAHFSRIT